MQFRLLDLAALVDGQVDLVDGHRRVNRANVNHRPTLFAVQVSEACHRLGTVKPENEGEVLVQCLFGDRLVLLGEGHALPVLPLVLPQVENLERFASLNAQKALASSMNTEAAQVTANPTAPELFRHSKGCPRPTEEVCDQITFVGRRLDDAL